MGEEAKTPTVLWAQRPDVVYLTIEVPGVEKDSAVVKVRAGPPHRHVPAPRRRGRRMAGRPPPTCPADRG